MKKIVLTLTAVVGLVFSTFAGEGWLTNFEEAKRIATKENKPILIDFTGSDWCGWCIKLDGEVFSKSEFKKYAKDKLVLFMADFPQAKEQPEAVKAQNSKLAEKFGVRGFPTVYLIDKDESVILKTGYQYGGPEKYVEHLDDAIKNYKK